MVIQRKCNVTNFYNNKHTLIKDNYVILTEGKDNNFKQFNMFTYILI